MTVSDDDPLRAEVHSIVARCIEAMDGGEEDPVRRLCEGRADLEQAVRERLTRLRDLELLDAPSSIRLDEGLPVALEAI
ncbi:MAG: hypothetical protein AAGB93_14230, partial [Planctomycetota bacterium]